MLELGVVQGPVALVAVALVALVLVPVVVVGLRLELGLWVVVVGSALGQWPVVLLLAGGRRIAQA